MAVRAPLFLRRLVHLRSQFLGAVPVTDGNGIPIQEIRVAAPGDRNNRSLGRANQTRVGTLRAIGT